MSDFYRQDFIQMDKNREYDLIEKSQAGDIESRNTLIEAHMGFLVSICKRHAFNCDYSDLIGDAVIGMINAIDNFNLNHAKRPKLITYAFYHIKTSLLRSEFNRTMFSMCDSRFQQLLKISEIESELDEDVDIETLAEMTRLSVGQVKSLKSVQKKILSLDVNLPESNTTYLDLVKDNQAGKEVNKFIVEHDLEFFLSFLSKRERKVVEMRFGIGEDDGVGYTNYGISCYYRKQLSENKVCKIFTGAMRKLRNIAEALENGEMIEVMLTPKAVMAR